MRIEARLEQRQQGDRRGSPRRELHLRLATLTGKRSPANVLVHDISESGVLLQTSSSLSVNETIEINLPQVGFRIARVTWTSHDFFGCKFDEPISPATVSAAQLQSEPTEASRSVSRAAIDSRSAHKDTFGTRLRRLREQYNLSQVGLARLLKVSKLSIWKWERDDVRPRQARIEALARIFAVSEAELLTGHTPGDASMELERQPPQGLAAVVDQCKASVAAHLGTTPDRVEITVKL